MRSASHTPIDLMAKAPAPDGVRDTPNGTSEGVGGHELERIRQSGPIVFDKLRSSCTRQTFVVIHPSRLFRECLVPALADFGDVGMHGGTVDDCADWLELNGPVLVLYTPPVDMPVEAICKTIADLSVLAIVIMFDRRDPAHMIAPFLAAGLSGYIPSTLELGVTLQAVKLVQAGGQFVPPDLLLQLLSARPEPPAAPATPAATFGADLTAKQLAVLDRIRRGKANKTIAYELNMCESTVKVHVRSIMKKLQVRNRTQVAFVANQMGCVFAEPQ
jgi:DNA-binding NarL/FixJ family response regulator